MTWPPPARAAPCGGPSPPRAGVDAHVLEGLDPAGGQPVAAHLLAREGGLLQDDDVETGAGEPVRGARARGAGADDDHVGEGMHGRRLRHVRALLPHSQHLVNQFTKSLVPSLGPAVRKGTPTPEGATGRVPSERVEQWPWPCSCGTPQQHIASLAHLHEHEPSPVL